MAHYSRGTRQPLLGHGNLAGTGRVGDELYLIACHEVKGRPYLYTRALGAGAGRRPARRADGPRRPAVTLRAGACSGSRRPAASLPPGTSGPASRCSGVSSTWSWRSPEPLPVRDWLLFLGRTVGGGGGGAPGTLGYLTRPREPDAGAGPRGWCRATGTGRGPRCCGRAPRWTRPGRRPVLGAAGRARRGLRPGVPVHGLTDAPSRTGEAARMLSRRSRADRPHPGDSRQHPAVPAQLTPALTPTDETGDLPDAQLACRRPPEIECGEPGAGP